MKRKILLAVGVAMVGSAYAQSSSVCVVSSAKRSVICDDKTVTAIDVSNGYENGITRAIQNLVNKGYMLSSEAVTSNQVEYILVK